MPLQGAGIRFIGALACLIVGFIVTFIAVGMWWNLAVGTDHARDDLVSAIVFTPLSIATITGMIIWGRQGMALAKQTLPGTLAVTGPLPQLDSPAPIDQVVAALNQLNDRGLPCRLDFTYGRHGQVIALVRWRAEEARWGNLFGAGLVRRTWVMKLKLKPRGRYGFTETTGTLRADASLTSWRFALSGSIFIGKTMNAFGMTRIWAPGQPMQELVLQAGQAKIPIFTILRAYGWRPNQDWWLMRMFEF
jgi:hypothetical protein